MKTFSLSLLLLASILPAHGQTPMRRLVSQTGTAVDWTPSKERTGNLTKFFQTTKKLGLTLRSSGLAWSDLNTRGFQLVANGLNVPFQHLIGVPGTHESGPHSTTLGKPANQWTQAECYNFGRNVIPVFGLTSDQLNEGYSAEEINGIVMTQSNTYRWIYEGMRDKAALMNPKGILIGSYETKFDAYQAFHPGGGAWVPNSQANRASLASGSAARSGLWWYNLDVSHYVMPSFQFYAHYHSLEVLYMQAYAIQRLQKACEGWANPGVTLSAWFFAWPVLEGTDIGDSYFPFEHTLPTGNLYQHSKVSFSYNSFLSMCLNTFVLSGPMGGAYIWEDSLTFSDANPSKVAVDMTGRYKPNDVWKPLTNAPVPTSAARPTMPEKPLGIFNAPILAGEYYGEMVAAGGENFHFTRFKIGNGAWIEPGAGNTSVLEAAAQYRGWCVTSQNGTGYGLYYTNPYAPVSGENITVDLGAGKTVTFDCYTDEPVVIAGTHPGGAVTFPRLAAFH